MTRKQHAWGVVALALASSAASAQLTNFSPKASFGSNGWLPSVASSTILDQGNLTRGMDYNPVSGNLIVVNRQGGVNINVLDGNTGAFVRTLNNTGITGGTFAANMAAVDAGGRVFIGNLALSGGNFKMYSFANDATADAATTVFDGTATIRTGDSLAIRGSGETVELVAGQNGGNGFTYYTSNGLGGLNGSVVNPTGAPNNINRLGIAFGPTDIVLGRDGNNPGGAAVLGVSTVAGTYSNGSNLADGNERLIDFATVGAFNLLATVQTDGGSNRNNVRIYDATDLNNLVLLGTQNLVGAGLANANGVGAISWGAVSGNTATLYAMNTNNGIQAFDVEVVPEPASMAALALGLGALAARRRRKTA